MLDYKKVVLKESTLLTVVRRCFWDNAPDTYRGGVVCKADGRTIWQEISEIDRLNHDDAMLDAYNLLDNYMRTTRELADRITDIFGAEG